MSRKADGQPLDGVLYTMAANAHWSLASASGPLRQTSAYDFESAVTPDDKTITIFATGLGGTAKSFNIAVNVTDVNEAPTNVTFGGLPAIDENDTGSVANSASSGDADAPATNSYLWSLVDPPSGVNDNGKFAINAFSGALSVSSAFNFIDDQGFS